MRLKLTIFLVLLNALSSWNYAYAKDLHAIYEDFSVPNFGSFRHCAIEGRCQKKECIPSKNCSEIPEVWKECEQEWVEKVLGFQKTKIPVFRCRVIESRERINCEREMDTELKQCLLRNLSDIDECRDAAAIEENRCSSIREEEILVSRSRFEPFATFAEKSEKYFYRKISEYEGIEVFEEFFDSDVLRRTKIFPSRTNSIWQNSFASVFEGRQLLVWDDVPFYVKETYFSDFPFIVLGSQIFLPPDWEGEMSVAQISYVLVISDIYQRLGQDAYYEIEFATPNYIQTYAIRKSLEICEKIQSGC